MIIEKNKIRSILKSHKIPSLQEKDEENFINFFHELLIELETAQQEKLATKEDIKNLMQLMEKRFEAVDKRFEAVDKRFEAVDKRFEEMAQNNNKRFEAIDKRFEDLYHYMDKRFEDMNRRFNMMFTFMSIGFTVIIVLTILFKFMQ